MGVVQRREQLLMTDTASPNPFVKYRNPDKRCQHPFTPDAAGYCFTYAHHVDGTAGYEDIEALCRRGPCEFWKEPSR